MSNENPKIETPDKVLDVLPGNQPEEIVVSNDSSATEKPDLPDYDTKRLEYQMAQEMLRHYDTLNWQIGSILIAGVLVLTGLIINKDAIELMGNSLAIGLGITLGLPILSLLILRTWLSWFERHQQLYNFRNEVLHRLEFQLKMYHYLKVVEAKLRSSAESDKYWKDLLEARRAAGYAPTPQDPAEGGANIDETDQTGRYKAIFENDELKGSSSSTLARRLAWGIPLAQLLLLGYILAVFHVPRLIRICICP